MRKLIIGSSVLAIIIGASLYLMRTGEGVSCYNELVCDTEKLFTNEQNKQLEEYHKALLERYDIDLHVVTGQASPEQAVAIFKAGNIGENSKTRKGILLLVDSKNDNVRLEISAGLDAVYTDGFVAYIEQRQMIPFFQANQVARGILATTEMLVTRAQEAIAGKAFVPPEQLPQNLAIGAGAQSKASIGTGYQAPQSSKTIVKTSEEMKPEEVVALYHKTLADGNTAYNLPIYSGATQQLRQKWVVTPAQMKNELTAYQKCDLDKVIILKERNLAVVRYKVEQRKCAPYFLVMEGEQWRLDFVTMMNNVRFNIDNDWHIDMIKPLPYADAFLDWSFNKDGYPFPHVKMRWGITVETNYRNNVTFIKKIHPDTPAKNMALQENDIILSWDGIKNANHEQVRNSMDSVEAGKHMKVQVLRGGQQLTLGITAPPKI